MKLLLLMAAFALVASVPASKEEWEAYKKKYNKTYPAGEDQKRYEQYLSRKFIVEEHNRGSSRYLMGINYFTDMYPEELKSLLLPPSRASFRSTPFKKEEGAEVPKSMNWVEKGAVTAVKDQKNCRASYAFSAVGALEGLMHKRLHNITDLSAQQLVDCDMGNDGCAGGSPQECFNYVSRKNPVTSAKSYPYVAQRQNCKASGKKGGVTTTGYLNIDDEKTLQDAVGILGPVSILFSVNVEKFFQYESGVYDDECGDYQNHAMLAVGYDTDAVTGTEYWLIKNSWSDKWGEMGYVKVIRNVNKCNLGNKASIPVYYF